MSFLRRVEGAARPKRMATLETATEVLVGSGAGFGGDIPISARRTTTPVAIRASRRRSRRSAAPSQHARDAVRRVRRGRVHRCSRATANKPAATPCFLFLGSAAALVGSGGMRLGFRFRLFCSGRNQLEPSICIGRIRTHRPQKGPWGGVLGHVHLGP